MLRLASLAIPLFLRAAEAFSAMVPSTSVTAPEAEFADALTSLGNLARRLESAREVTSRPGLGPQKASADRSWRNAHDFFSHKEWLSTVRELNNFLNQTQVPEPSSYLEAQYILGLCYEQLSYNSKALRAHFRYLAAFLTATSPDHAQLTDVLRRMLPLALKSGDEMSKRQLNELLAAVTTLDLPSDVQPLVFFFAAKAAQAGGQTSVASTWLDRASESPSDPILKAKSLYLKALLVLSQKDEAQAEDFLSQAIQADPEGSVRDQARLALARLAVKNGRRETALKYYALIAETSWSFKDATFEQVYVLLDLHQDAKARAEAMLYLAKWPEGADALQLRGLLAYLDMRAGDLSAAQTSIDDTNERLRQIKGWMQKHLSGNDAVGKETLSTLVQLTGDDLAVSPSVQATLRLYARMGELSRRLADAKAEIQSAIFALGRSDLSSLKPYWANRAEQLATIGDDLLKVGHRLAAAERHLYADHLSPADLQRLQASEARRTKLLTANVATKRHLDGWKNFAHFADLTKQIADTARKLRNTQAELAAARRLEVQRVSAAPGKRAIQSLTETATRLERELTVAIEKIRRERTKASVVQSPHQAIGKFLTQYAASLHEESEILRSARDHASQPAERLNAQDAARAWGHWQALHEILFRDLKDLDQAIQKDLDQTFADLDRSTAFASELSQRLDDLKVRLHKSTQKSIGFLAAQYGHALDVRFARHQKWRADIDWLTYQSKSEEKRKSDTRFDLERQILQDNLMDLKQGVITSWPE